MKDLKIKVTFNIRPIQINIVFCVSKWKYVLKIIYMRLRKENWRIASDSEIPSRNLQSESFGGRSHIQVDQRGFFILGKIARCFFPWLMCKPYWNRKLTLNFTKVVCDHVSKVSRISHQNNFFRRRKYSWRYTESSTQSKVTEKFALYISHLCILKLFVSKTRVLF